MPLSRRLFLGATLPLLAACTTPLPIDRRSTATISNDDAASKRLRESADAHGLAAYRAIDDVSVGYTGQWRPLIGRIQPDVVDAAYRGSSEERLIPRLGLVAQDYSGPAGRKLVSWRQSRDSSRAGDIAVWRNGAAEANQAALDAAALVAECYNLFLLGPLWLIDRGSEASSSGTEHVSGRLCDVVDVWVRPGFGRVGADRVSIYIDRVDHVARRFRFTLEGTANTRGAVAETDTFDHQRIAGVLWPMRSYERVVHPLRLPAHDWHVTGLDVNRGLKASELAGPVLSGAAAAPAAALRP